MLVKDFINIMENDITPDVLDLISNIDDSADNGVKNIKSKVKAYSERLNNDRQKIRTELDSEYKTNLSKLLGVEVKDLTQDEIDSIINSKIENSDVVKEANRIIAENNQKMVQEALDSNILKIKAINPDIDTAEKLIAHPQYADIDAKVKKGYDLYDAYVSVVGISNNDSGQGGNPGHKSISSNTIPYVQSENISESTLAAYRRAFPGKSDEEIIKMYRRDRTQ